MDTQQHWEDSQQWGEITQAGDSPDSWRTASMASAMAESSAMAALREVEHQGAGIHEQAEPWWSAQNVLPAIQTGASAIASAGVDILSTVGPYQGTRMLVKAVYPGASEALSSSVFFGGRAALQSIKRMHEAIKKRAADNQARAMAVSDAMDMLAGFDEANSLPHMQEHCKVQICAHLADYVQGSTVSSAVNDAIESANADPLAIIRNLEWQVTQHHVLSNRRS